MFLRKEEKEIETGSVYIVPYCKYCDSQNIETKYICKDCGSNDIKVPTLFDDDKKAIKHRTEKKTVYIYKCDNCGDEFNAFTESQTEISYLYGEFVPYKDDEDGKTYSLGRDLCNNCIKEIVDKLNKELDDITDKEHVNKVIKGE